MKKDLRCPKCNSKLKKAGKVELPDREIPVFYCRVCGWRGI